MPTQARILELVEEVLDSDLTPEEVCIRCPELLLQVKDHVDRCRSMSAQIESIFPSSQGASRRKTRTSHLLTDLPEIPGYEVESILGRGGIGIVYQARHLRLNRRVAVKMLLSGEYASALELTRFMREARSVASLRHVHIVPIHDVGDFEGRPYYTMELVDGGTLAQKLAGVPQPAREAAVLVRILAQAVQAAHEAGIVHRDLKPSNILLTRDGTPKISDFGLARRLEDDSALTLSGVRLGTPSYMSPEQAGTTADAICPPVDIYALGAILYETLTGRPPFRAETAIETQRQVVCEEPAPPSRLNTKVPRDLETICLKCLNKNPTRRYENAAALADDLDRYLRGEPIAARRTGFIERAAKWTRRRPAFAVAIAASLLLAFGIGAVMSRVESLRNQSRRAVEAELKELADLEAWGQWSDAEATVKRAQARLDNGGADDLRELLAHAQGELDLVAQLDAIRLSRVTNGALIYYRDKANQDYQQAFDHAGLAKLDGNLDESTAHIKASPIRGALVEALDDWAVSSTDINNRRWLLELATRTDSDPRRLREHVRDPDAWSNPATLTELTRTVSLTGNSISPLLALGERLKANGRDPTAFLKLVQKGHPADFWINLALGDALYQEDSADAGIYYRAALASRPNAAVSYSAVGDSLRLTRKSIEAVEYYQKALLFDPTYARAQNNLGNAYDDMGRVNEAIECYQKALKLDPDYMWAHLDMANAFTEAGRFDEAAGQFKAISGADPKNPDVQTGIRMFLVRQGRDEEARVEWQKSLEARPPEYKAWTGYAELCLYLGKVDEYHHACDEAVEQFGNRADRRTAEQLSRTCMLMPVSGDLLKKASEMASRAVAGDGSAHSGYAAYSMFARGLADYRAGRLSNALAIMNRSASSVMGPCPDIVAAMALEDEGNHKGAQRSLAAGVIKFDWCPDQADRRDLWIYHILRREAEAKIQTNLAAFLDGKYQPAENEERIALLASCQSRALYGKTVALYVDAFKADPGLKEDLSGNTLLNAARTAAMAGNGDGQDAAKLSDSDRARLRAQADRWLEDALILKLNRLDHSNPDECSRLKGELGYWQKDPELAGVRELSALQKFPPDEQNKFLSFWDEVAADIKQLDAQS